MTPRPESSAEAEVAVPTGPKQPLWRKLLGLVVTIAVVVAVFGFVIPSLADYGDVLDVIGEVGGLEWLALGLLAGLFLVAYVFVLMAVLRSLRFTEGFVTQTAATGATNSLPAGGAVAFALNYAMLMSWGFAPEAVTAGLLAAGVWDQLTRFAVPAISVTVISLMGDGTRWMWLAAALGIVLLAGAVVILVAIFRSERLAAAMGRFADRVVNRVLSWIRRDRVDLISATLEFRGNVIGIANHRFWRITFATLVNHISMLALFVGALRAVGEDQIPTAWIVLSFSLARLLAAIPISPGGLGLVDVGFLGLLSLGAADVDPELIAAGVLVFRALTFLPPIPIGLGCWLYWRADKRWRRDWRTERRGSFALAADEAA